jgi:hypothetical protein
MRAAETIVGPLQTFLRQYAAVLAVRPTGRTVCRLVVGVLLGWWIYVPVHEILHAVGCMMLGGHVTQLEIQPLYGGAILERILPFVSAGGNYAGRLSGFDTGGSDVVYFTTVYFPYVLSLGGLWLMETAVTKRSAVIFGVALPCALAPLIGLTGDFLEAGSLILYQLWPGVEQVHRQLISDDLFRLLETLGERPLSRLLQLGFIAISLLIGAVLAWGTLIAADRIRAAAAGPA